MNKQQDIGFLIEETLRALEEEDFEITFELEELKFKPIIIKKQQPEEQPQSFEGRLFPWLRKKK